MPVPRFEPEVIDAMEQKLRRDGKGPDMLFTSAIKSLTVNGVRITSTHGKPSELDLMAAAVSEMPWTECQKVKSVFFDDRGRFYHLETASRTAALGFRDGIMRLIRGCDHIFTNDNGLHFEEDWSNHCG